MRRLNVERGLTFLIVTHDISVGRKTDRIVRIDPATGRITAEVDASGLLAPEQRAGTDVLNGIAAVPGTDEFLVTGKNWPTIFRVRFTR